jgi:hypothetical protein
VFTGGFKDGDSAADIVVVDFCRLVDALSDAHLGGLMIDHVRFGDEFFDGLIVDYRPFDEFVAATGLFGCLTSDRNSVVIDAEIVVRNEVSNTVTSWPIAAICSAI